MTAQDEPPAAEAAPEKAPAEAAEDAPADAGAAVDAALSSGPEEGSLGFKEDTTPKPAEEESTAGEAAEPPGRKIYLAGRLFSSRADLAAHVKKIQDSVAEDDGTKGELSTEDNLFIFHLLLHHPKAVEKMVKPISHFRYGIYDKFKNKCFISVGADGSQEGVSAAKSIDVIYPRDGAGKTGDGSSGLVAEPKEKPAKDKKRQREEEKPPEPRAFEPQEMVRGCVMDINKLPAKTHYHRLKELLNGFGKVKFLQFLKSDAPAEPPKKKAKTEEEKAEEGAEEEEQEGDEEEEEERPMSARCRFADPEGAAAALQGLAEAEVQGAIVEVALLAGEAEEAYWEETNRKLKEAWENPKPKGKEKGKDKGKGKGKGKKGKKGKHKHDD